MGLTCSVIPSTCAPRAGVWKPAGNTDYFRTKPLLKPWDGGLVDLCLPAVLDSDPSTLDRSGCFAGGKEWAGRRSPHLSQGLAANRLQARSGPPPVFVNKVLLEHSHTPLFMYHPWLLLGRRGWVEKLHQRLDGPPSRKCCLVAQSFWLFGTLWTVACQAPLFMEFPGKNPGLGYHSLLGDLPDPGMEAASPALTGGFFTSTLPGKALSRKYWLSFTRRLPWPLLCWGGLDTGSETGTVPAKFNRMVWGKPELMVSLTKKNFMGMRFWRMHSVLRAWPL